MPLELPKRNALSRAVTRQMSLGEIIRFVEPSTRLSYGIRDLEPGEERLLGFIVPTWQRPSIWSEKQNIRFIESIWVEASIGSYIVNVDVSNAGDKAELDGILVDGRQRLTAIDKYMRNQFRVFGAFHSELSDPQKRAFMMRQFARCEVSFDTLEELKEVYERLAYGGIPHQAEKTIPALEAALEALKGSKNKEVCEKIRDALKEWNPDVLPSTKEDATPTANRPRM